MHFLNVYKHTDKPLGELPKVVVKNPRPISGELLNLVPILKKRKDGDAILRQIGNTTVDEYDEDKGHRRQWETRMARSLKKFNSYNENKNYPYPNSSNIVVPFLSIAVLQYYARALAGLITPSGVVKVVPVKPEDKGSAWRVEKHMNYIFNYEIPNYYWETAKMLIAQGLYGSAFRKTFFDPMRMTIQSRYVSPFSLVFPNNYTSFEELPRVTHIYKLSANEIRERILAGIFDNVWDNIDLMFTEQENEGEKAYREMMGLTAGDMAPGTLLECHTWWDLDGDKVEEPYIVTVDYESRRPVRIIDRLWFDFYQRPQLLDFFTHYQFVPNPEGILGIGFETLLGQLSSAASTVINEMIDAGHLANTQGGFIQSGTRLKHRGQLFLERGKYIEVDADTDDLRKAIYNLDFREPGGALFNLLNMLFDYSQNVVSATQTPLGQSPKSDTANMANLVAMEESRMLLGIIHRGNLESLKRECFKVFRINGMFLNDDKYFPIVGDQGQITDQQIQVGQTDYNSVSSVVPAAPGNLNYRVEEMVKAKELFGLVMGSPLAQSPEALQMSFGRLLRSFDIPENETMVLTQAMAQAMQPPQPLDLPPYQENAAFLRAEFPQVLKTQNHEQHMMEHERFYQGDDKVDLNPEGEANLLRHMAHHRAFAYEVRQEQGLQPGDMLNPTALMQQQGVMEEGNGGAPMQRD